MEIRSTSPDGRYVVGVDSFEARAFTWVDTPELFDTVTGRELLALTDRYWHLDAAIWRSDCVVQLSLRHYPNGNASVSIDCRRLTVSVNQAAAQPLAQLERQLERTHTQGPG